MPGPARPNPRRIHNLAEIQSPFGVGVEHSQNKSFELRRWIAIKYKDLLQKHMSAFVVTP